jgi:hypothetical protein
VTSLAYQLVVDALLTAILTAECALDHVDWLGDDMLKRLFKADVSIYQLYAAPSVKAPVGVTPGWWQNWGALSFGSLGVLAAAEAEILIPDLAEG